MKKNLAGKGVIKQTENQFSHLVKKITFERIAFTTNNNNSNSRLTKNYQPNIVPPNFRKALWFKRGNLVKNNIVSQ